jgi:hypothetical protein
MDGQGQTVIIFSWPSRQSARPLAPNDWRCNNFDREIISP